jgi:hypothetical protein
MSSTKQQLLEAIEAAPESVLEELLMLLQVRIQSNSLMAAIVDDNELSAELAQWEAASDEDALEFEALLLAEEV